jgi:hypothetical protein
MISATPAPTIPHAGKRNRKSTTVADVAPYLPGHV